jgi:aspartate racemase
MKTLGIVGGIGPESTIEYYRSIVREYRKAASDGSSPDLVIISIDVRVFLDLIEKRRYAETSEYIGKAIESLAKAGADFALLAANTPHILFEDFRKGSSIPLLSIVEVTCRAAITLQLKRVGLIGTRFTMQSDFYQRQFAQEAIEVVVPRGDEQDLIHEIYVGELLNGRILSLSRQRVCTILGRMIRDHRVDGVILAGTELPLLLDGMRELESIPFLDTTQIHVKAAVSEMLS